MAILTYSDLQRFHSGLTFNTGSANTSSPITTAMAADAIEEAEAEVAAIAEAKGYDWTAILATSGDSVPHRLYTLGRSFTGHQSAAVLGAAYTRGQRSSIVEMNQERANQLRERLEALPSYAAGADARTGTDEPNHIASGGTEGLTGAEKASRSYLRNTLDNRRL